MPASRPATMSVVHAVADHRGPVSEWACRAFRALRIISGSACRRSRDRRPVARVISAATEPVAGSGPLGDGTGRVGVVAMKRAPPLISRIAWVIRSKL